MLSFLLSCGGGGDGDDNGTSDAGDTQAPSVPTTLTVTTVSSSEISLSWDESTDNVAVVGYKIYRGGSYRVSVSTNIAADTGLSPDTQYCYQVSAYDAAGNESGKSAQKCATTQSSGGGGGAVDSEKPTIPSSLSAVAASSSQIDLSWNASTDNVGVTGYKVYKDGSYLTSVSGTVFSDTGLTANTQYCYRVSAYDAAGNESDKSSESCATTQNSGGGPTDNEAPSVPTGLTAQATSSTEITVSWTPSTDNVGVVGYRIYYNNGHLLYDLSASYFTTLYVSSLQHAKQYCFSVSAYDAAGNESAQCAQVCATTLASTTPDNSARGSNLYGRIGDSPSPSGNI